MATISEALATAFQHHQGGRLQAAEQIYRQILTAEPRHADALHLLGVIAFQDGKHETAIDYIKRAIRLNGNVAAFHNNLGGAYFALQGPEDPGKLAEAVACYRRALKLKPDYAEAHNNLGNALRDQGKLDEAIACYRKARKLEPNYAEAAYNLGNALKDQEKLDEAVVCYRRAVQLKPGYAEAHNNLGNVLNEQGQPEEAAACFRKALELKPDYAEAHNNLGNAFQAQGKLDEAAACFRKAVEQKPDYAVAYNNLGLALKNQGNLDEAVACCRRALELRPDYAEGHNSLGIALWAQGNLAEAAACYGRALELTPDYAEAHLNRALFWLLSGNFAQGFPEFEWRWRKKDFPPRGFRQPLWDGGPLQEKTILLHAEQGFGDTFQFIRYAAWVRRRHPLAKVVVEVQQPLLGLLACSLRGDGLPPAAGPCQGKEQACSLRGEGLPPAAAPGEGKEQTDLLGIDQLVGHGAALPEFDVHAPLLSLPWLCQTTLENVPADVPYLHAAPGLVTQWRERLNKFPGFKIGICWQGNSQYRGDRFRSIPLRRFAALAQVPGICWISLQKSEGSEQLAEVRNEFPVVDLAKELDEAAGPFMDTAAVMTNLDLVITSDTAIAHLAGALGVPAWVALPYVPDWRWLLRRSDSPWYPAMRLFRQKSRGDWAGVFEEMKIALCEQLHGDHSHPYPAAARGATCRADMICDSTAASAQTHGNLGLALQNQGKLAEAVACYRRALDLDPDYADVHSNLGLALQNQGKLAEAVACYRRALELKPNLAEAHNNLGLALKGLGKLEDAVACYHRALALKPNVAEIHDNLGLALRDQGKLEEAVASYRHALELKPDHAEACNNLGLALQDQGRLDEAIVCYRRVLTLKPDHGDVYCNLGNAIREQGKLDEAIACYRHALARKPDYAEAHNNLGNALRDQGKLDEAVACYRRALELRPDYALAHGNLGVALRDHGELAAAVACYRRALELKPDDALAYGNLGVTLRDQGELDEALVCHRRALVLEPDCAEAHNNLGNVLRDLGKLDEATECYRRALELKPDYAEAHNNLGGNLHDLGKRDEAAECYRRALELKPDYAEAHLNRALTWLLSGNLAQGWPEYEWRWRMKGCLSRGFRQPLWDGQPLQQKTILLHAEQGFGDTFQFIRYALWIRRHHAPARVVVEVQEPLLPLLACSLRGDGLPSAATPYEGKEQVGFFGIDQLIGSRPPENPEKNGGPAGETLPEFDVHAPLMSLPWLCRTTLENVPAEVPYLHAAPGLVAQWRDRLSKLDGFKIGICWQGNRQYRGDRLRSIPLRHFAVLAQIPGICWISLQKGAGSKQLAQGTRYSGSRRTGCPGNDFPVVDLAEELDEEAGPFMDTAAVMTNLDLVITSDTAIAHLAGAIGVPVWVALPAVPDWRWLLERSDSPWYPTMRFFRQRSRGDWLPVFDEMKTTLGEQLHANHS